MVEGHVESVVTFEFSRLIGDDKHPVPVLGDGDGDSSVATSEFKHAFVIGFVVRRLYFVYHNFY